MMKIINKMINRTAGGGFLGRFKVEGGRKGVLEGCVETKGF